MLIRRLLLTLTLLFTIVSIAKGQNTTLVTSTVKDPNGVAYAFGTYGISFTNPTTQQAFYGGVPLQPSQMLYTGQLDVNGALSISLPSNAVITPAGTQWTFKICANASQIAMVYPPPTLPCFNSAQTISGSSQVITFTAATIPVAAGGGITSAASLPGTCTPGTTAPVSLTINGVGYGIFRCIATNVWAPDDPQQSISPLAYGAKWDVKAVTDCPFTNGSNVVTCPAGEAQFTSADLGKIFSGRTSPGALTTGCNGAQCGSEVIPQGFICTINSPNSVSIGLTYPGCAADNSTAVCTPSTTVLCSALWGTQDDSAAIQSAAVAAWTGNSCKTVVFPSGMAFITIPAGGLLKVTIPNGSPCAGVAIADATQGGAQVAGQGGSNSILVPLSTVNFTNCTGGGSGTACIAGPPNWFAHDWGVWGFGLADNGTTHANNLIEFNGVSPSCTAAAAWNMNLAAWETASSSSQGFVIQSGCGTLYASNIVSEGFANTNCSAINSSTPVFPTTLSGMDCFGSSGAAAAGASLSVSGGTVNSTGGSYWGVNSSATSPAAVKFTGSTVSFNSFSDTIVGAVNGNNSFGIWFSGAGANTITLSGSTVTGTNSTGASNSSLLFCPSSATSCTINAFATNFVASGTKMQMFLKTGTPAFNFFDGCSNTFTQGSIANSAFNAFGSCSITGTTQTAANITPTSGFGTGCVTAGQCISAVTGSTQLEQFTVTYGTSPASPQVITIAFPAPFQFGTPICTLTDVGGTNAFPTSIVTTTCTLTGASFTVTNTPVGGSTEVLQVRAMIP